MLPWFVRQQLFIYLFICLFGWLVICLSVCLFFACLFVLLVYLKPIFIFYFKFQKYILVLANYTEYNIFLKTRLNHDFAAKFYLRAGWCIHHPATMFSNFRYPFGQITDESMTLVLLWASVINEDVCVLKSLWPAGLMLG